MRSGSGICVAKYSTITRKDYTSAFQFVQDFLELVKTSPVVYSIDNMGGANMQLGMISIYRGEYESAALFANTAREYFTKGSVNFVNASDALFLSFFTAGFMTRPLFCWMR